MKTSSTIYLGVKSHVVAIDKETGRILWKTKLGGSLGDSFVNIHFDGSILFAYTKGELYAVDPENGRIRWSNPMKGFWYGIATFASTESSATNFAAIMRKKGQNDAADGGTTAVIGAGT